MGDLKPYELEFICCSKMAICCTTLEHPQTTIWLPKSAIEVHGVQRDEEFNTLIKGQPIKAYLPDWLALKTELI